MKKRFVKLISMLLAVVMTVTMLPLGSTAEDMAPEDVPPGYITDENKKMAYQFINGCIDIQGLFDGKWKSTTYDNSGFSVYFKQGTNTRIKVDASGSKEPVNSVPGITIKTIVSFQNYGKLLKISYTVENLTGSPVTYSLGSQADIQIGADDLALITKLDDSKGFKMVSGHDEDKNADGEYAQFNFFGRGVTGITDVTDFWYGDIDDLEDMAFGEESSIVDGRFDAGMGYSWKDKTIGSNDTQTYSVLIGVGGAGSEEEADKSFYTLTVDGSYESVTGEGSYEPGTTVAINAGSRNNYSFSGWTSSGGGTFENADSANTTFIMPDNNVTVTANWSPDTAPTPDTTTPAPSPTPDSATTPVPSPTPDSATPPNPVPPSDNTIPPENPSSSQTPISRPYQSMTGAITLPGEADKNGKASVTLTKNDIGDAIAAAYAEAEKAKVFVKDISAVINIKADKKIKQCIINIPKSAQNLLNSNKIISAEFRINGCTIRFNSRAIKQLFNTAQEDALITVTQGGGKKLTGKAKKLIGSRPMYDFQISCDKGKIIDNFGADNIYIAIPYELKKGEVPEQIHIYDIDKKGNAQRQLSFYDKEQKAAAFVLSSYSRFGIGYNADVPKFSDSKDHWAKEEINYTVSCGLFKGTSGNTFSADKVLSRGMTAVVLGRMAGVNIKNYTAGDFTDVDKKAYYAPYAAWAVKYHIMEETESKQFSPDKAVTREQLAVIMVNYAKQMGYSIPAPLKSVSFSDSSSINEWASKETAIMQQAGIFQSKDRNRFAPQTRVTRGEAAAILSRFMKVIIDQETAQGWTKNDSGHWIYYEDGKKLVGWQTISGTEYYFNVDGTFDDTQKR